LDIFFISEILTKGGDWHVIRYWIKGKGKIDKGKIGLDRASNIV